MMTSHITSLKSTAVILMRKMRLLSSARLLCSQAPINKNKKNISRDVTTGPSLQDFISSSQPLQSRVISQEHEKVPYINDSDLLGHQRSVYFETHGCQMNVNDTEIAWSILQKKGYMRAESRDCADVILLMTCAIREGAEAKIWKKLQGYRSHKRKKWREERKDVKVGVLGCMAERLKTQILEKEKCVDLVCGPDAYRDLPRMLSHIKDGQTAVNVLLSLEETYADVVPVRMNPDSTSAYVSIMRGCDNMCSYCIVPFTRGRERSRPIESIVEEVKQLSMQGVKEVTLLGQNVNSYCDRSSVTHAVPSRSSDSDTMKLSAGFSTIYKPKKAGLVFADLLDRVAQVDPEMRIRFTSPHPKDFPDEVLEVISSHGNICKQLHLPAQSGSTRVLNAMRRGYSREAYLKLVQHVRDIIPDIKLSGDIITGFCGETESDHHDTLSLVDFTDYTFLYCFPYSMRQKTHAYHKLQDDVPDDVKARRHEEVHALFRRKALHLNQQQIGETQLVMVEGDSRRSNQQLAGRNDGNTKVILPKHAVRDAATNTQRQMAKADYVAVKITDASSQVLHGEPLYITSLQNYNNTTAKQQQNSAVR